jgi:hypothetical protein
MKPFRSSPTDMKRKRLPLRAACAALVMAALALGAVPAAAVDLQWSGFATLGWARTDAEGRYLRTIDRDGSFSADSVLAGQLEARFSPTWTATVQLKAALDNDHDRRWALRPAWALVGWRPNDEWQLRAGRMRAPLYLQSESLDVGVAHPMARLPVEMYSIAPNNEYDGASATYSWVLPGAGDAELSVELWGGRSRQKARMWVNEDVPGLVSPGARFTEINGRVAGLVLAQRQPGTTLRLGLTEGRAELVDGSRAPVRYPFVPLGPGIGYWRTDESLPGPPIDTVQMLRNQVLTAGIEQRLVAGLRVQAEFARVRQLRTELGSDTRGGYVALLGDAGDFTPYLSLSALRTSAEQMDWYRRLVTNSLPSQVPGAVGINTAQRLGALAVYAANQRTTAIGSAWRPPFGGSVKLEWARTQVDEVSRLRDAPVGAPPLSSPRFDTWTLSYSLAF